MPAAHHVFCSREESRQARKIINERIYPFLANKDPANALPEDCPIHPSLDIFKHQEAHKGLVPAKHDVLQCGFCGKQFKTEFYMDRHMDNKHGDKLSWGAEDSFSSRCFGDLCGVLGCGEYAFETGCFAAGVGSRGEGKKGCESCDSGEMDRRRHRCKALFHRCFDSTSEVHAGIGRQGTESLLDHFIHQFCDHLGCDAHYRHLPPPTKEGTKRQRPPPGAASWNRGGVGDRPPRGADGQNSRLLAGGGGDAGRTAKAILIVVILIGLAVLYGNMLLNSRSLSTRDDLRRAKRERKGPGSEEDRKSGARSYSGVGRASGFQGLAESSGLSRRRARILG